MITGALDPLIHDPARLRIVATLAALPAGDGLSATRLQDMLGLPGSRLSSGLRELGQASYVRTRTGDGTAQITVALTRDGRDALDRYTAALRRPPEVAGDKPPAPMPAARVSDADRDAAAAALGEHFAQGRLTLDELCARLDATLTASTYGELSQVSLDLPDLPVRPARVSFPRRKSRGRGTDSVCGPPPAGADYTRRHPRHTA
jgi:DNA-binding MarR family transcriptional regulator